MRPYQAHQEHPSSIGVVDSKPDGPCDAGFYQNEDSWMTLLPRLSKERMNFWSKLATPQSPARLKHELVVGPYRQNEPFDRPARLYYCAQCKWSFVVCGRAIAILDENGDRVAEDSLRRFNSPTERTCPVLE